MVLIVNCWKNKKFYSLFNENFENNIRNHRFRTYAKFFEKLTFLAHWYVHVREEMLGFFLEIFANGWTKRMIPMYLLCDKPGVYQVARCLKVNYDIGPSRHLFNLFKINNWNNLFKFNNKDTRTMSLTSF